MTKVREGRATHTRLKSQHNHAHKSQLELKTQLKEFSTQLELKSLSQRIECARMESWCLEMIKECLVCSSMRLGVSFIAPRQLGAIGDQLGRQFLPSVEWCTGQSGAPPDSPVNYSRTSPVNSRERPVRSNQPGAPDTVRCTTRQSGEL